jgi:pimeloyl-ACP methyl ester carboxylesterase
MVGHSLGGLVGLLLACKHKGLLTAFVNVEGNLVAEDCFFSREVMTLPFLGHEKDYFERFSNKLRQSKKPGFGRYAQRLRTNIRSTRAWYDYCKSLVACSDREPLLDWFLQLGLPRMFVCGAENALPYLHLLPQGGIEVAQIQKSSHFPHHSNPRQFYSVVAQFLAKWTSRSPA